MPGLVPPNNLTINFAPSPRQYELWKLLQPDCCPHCGGKIEQVLTGYDTNHNPQYKPQCVKCGTQNLPQLILGGGAAGGGKALLLDELVCTPFGFKKVGDLKEGDMISNPNTGGLQHIVYVHPIEIHDYYRISFIDGTYIDCSAGHLWECYSKSKRVKDSAAPSIDKIWRTDVMYKWYQTKSHEMLKEDSLIIPLTKPVRFTLEYQKLDIHPYILGALISNGHLESALNDSSNISFTTIGDEIAQQFEKYGYNMSHLEMDRYQNSSTAYSIHNAELFKYLRDIKLTQCESDTIFIPNCYKLSSIKDRIALIQGLIDMGGSVDAKGHIVYTTTSKQLADDVAFIIRSLGGIAIISQNTTRYKRNGELIQHGGDYDVQIYTQIDPELCSVSRKKKYTKYKSKKRSGSFGKCISNIEYIGKREGKCITVDDPSGLYITNDFTVTHNSYVGSCWIISSCLRFPELRAVIARKTIKSLKESTFNTIKAVMKQWGLKENENYKINNLEGVVTFWNNSTILLKELEDLPSDSSFERLGSSEWTIGFVDEVSEISERAIEVLFSRLRWKIHDTFKIPRLLMTTNPCITWVRSRFVQDADGNPVVCKESEAYVPFSVFDNPDIAFRQIYESSLNKITDPAVKARLLYGNWDFVDTNNAAAYWKFNGEHHLKYALKEKVYDPLKPIILSFDFNVIPFMSCLVFQIDYNEKKVYVLEEILGRAEDKENNTPKLAQKIKNKYLNEQHTGGLFITGDPAGLARSTQTEDGINNYTIIQSNLEHPTLRPQLKLLKRQPSQTGRLDYINALFGGFDGWQIKIDMRCRRFTEDLIYQKKNADGTKSKAKATDPKLGVKYEKHGHLSDCFDYCLCLFLNESWGHFQSKSIGVTTTTIPMYEQFEF